MEETPNLPRKPVDELMIQTWMIADFMELPENYICPEYSKSWSALMPVIERIEKIQGVVTVMKNRRFQITYGKKKFSCHTIVKINSAYRVVVEFLDWYSNQPQKAS